MDEVNSVVLIWVVVPRSRLLDEREKRIQEIADRLADRLRDEWPDKGVTLPEIGALVGWIGCDTLREVADEMLLERVRPRKGYENYCCRGVRTANTNSRS